MRLTTADPRLDHAELATTATAVVVSTAFYVQHGHSYLARGVLGDLGGFALLGGEVLIRRRRLRHEALICLGCIGAVLRLQPVWPRTKGDAFWWTAVGVGLTAYLYVRSSALRTVDNQE